MQSRSTRPRRASAVRVEAVTDVSDLRLSGDGRTLFAVQGLARVLALDAETLTVTGTYPAPDGVCPSTVEVTGGKVVAGYLNCGAGSGGLALVQVRPSQWPAPRRWISGRGSPGDWWPDESRAAGSSLRVWSEV
jgi:hypothetical protein